MSPDKSSIAVITDSTCNIPPELVKQHNIYVVLQHLIWGTEDLLDQKDIDNAGFYQRLPRDPVHPKTSQPPAREFAAMIEQAKTDGATQALILTVSQPLSGTYSSAKQSTDLVDIPVEAYDSRSAGMGLGWQVLAAARARDAGSDVNGMIEAAKKVREHLQMLLVVDTLEYLHKGGRIGGAQKLIGTALNLKPRLRVNPESGLVEAVERTRTRSKAVEGMYQAFFEKMDTSKPMHIAVHDAAAPKDAEALADRIRDQYHPTELFVTPLTPVLGTHVGPGTLAITGYYDD